MVVVKEEPKGWKAGRWGPKEDKRDERYDGCKIKLHVLKSASSDEMEEAIVDYSVVWRWNTLKNMMDDVGFDPEVPMEEQMGMPLSNVSTSILPLVIKFTEFYNDCPWPYGDQRPETGDAQDVKERRDVFEKLFFDGEGEGGTGVPLDQAVLFELILAANYLEFKPLLDTCCRRVANMIKGKSPEEIRKQFGIKNDFTPEEEEKVRKENEWCLEN